MFDFNPRSLNNLQNSNLISGNDKSNSNENSFKENFKGIPKNFEKALEKLLNEKINIETCSEIVFEKDNCDSNNINTKSKCKLLSPNFIASSEKNEALYLLFPRIGRDKKIVYQFFYLCEISDKVEIKEFLLKFESKNKNKINKVNSNYKRNANDKSITDAELLINRIEIHQRNQNQLCFFSKDKLAFISDLHSLKDLKNKETIEIIIDQEVDNQNHNKNIFNKKIKFSDFDDYYGLISSDNIFCLYSIGNNLPEITINFDSNVVDFDFGKASKKDILQPFSLFFLKENGEILSCFPIFPKLINAEIFDNFDSANSIYNLKEISPVNIDNNDGLSLNNIEGFKSDDSENTILKIIKNLKSCIICKTDQTKKHKLEQNKIVFNQKKLIEINDYLNSFNRNFTLQNINISNKSVNLVNENYTSRSLEKTSFSENAFLRKYTQLQILATFPVTFLRVFDNYILEIIALNDEIRPLINQNIFKKDEFLINAVITEIINFNHYPETDFSELKIIKNKLDSSQVLINNINDIYTLKIYNYLQDPHQNEIKYKNSDLKKIIKIDYMMKNNLNKQILGYFGIDFLYSKKNKNQILIIKTNLEKNFKPYLFSTLINKDNSLKYNLDKKENQRIYRRIRNSFEKIVSKKNANEYFSKLEQIYQRL
jgi:hypothetical protein